VKSFFIIIIGCGFLLMSGYVQAQQQESITITTYYPAPYGVYKELRAQHMAIGGDYYDPSQYCWPPNTCANQIVDPDNNDTVDLVVQGRVGIGNTQPDAALDVKVSGNVVKALKVTGDDVALFLSRNSNSHI
jgi:hypothetical protein